LAHTTAIPVTDGHSLPGSIFVNAPSLSTNPGMAAGDKCPFLILVGVSLIDNPIYKFLSMEFFYTENTR
jgi:hypothetical protein